MDKCPSGRMLAPLPPCWLPSPLLSLLLLSAAKAAGSVFSTSFFNLLSSMKTVTAGRPCCPVTTQLGHIPCCCALGSPSHQLPTASSAFLSGRLLTEPLTACFSVHDDLGFSICTSQTVESPLAEPLTSSMACQSKTSPCPQSETYRPVPNP